MAINEEYKRKIDFYLKNFSTYIITDVLSTDYKGFITRERLTLDEAKIRDCEDYPIGREWGYPGEYLWLFTTITVPKECEGESIALTTGDGECIAWVNGRIMGSFDREHKYIFLTDSAVVGETYEIALEVFAGYGKKGLEADHATGPINERTVHQFEVANKTQKSIKGMKLITWNEELYKAYMDLKTLNDLRVALPADSQRLAEVDKVLKAAVSVIDFERPYDDMLETVRLADKLLEPALAMKNSPSTPTMYAFGHSHLDLEWLWTDAETRRKIARTVGNQLQLAKMYPEYRYLQSQPWLMDVLKNEYPELYEEFKQAVKCGNIIVDGAMWVEPDLNVPTGESLIRQMMYGKKFIMDEFGIDSRMVWVPDVFGCGCSLPQIIKGCDSDYFFNAKLNWTYNGGTPIPASTFIWRGIDGTEVPTHLISGYGATCVPGWIKRAWTLYQSKEQAPLKAFAFGYSDGGGGATREHLEYFRRETDLEGLPKMKMSSPQETFDALCDYGIAEKYSGELYYCAHRGTYTSQAKTKLLNRLSELALRNAEMANAIFGGDDREAYEKLWKTVLFNQFHDIIPGSSISEVYEQAERQLADVVSGANTRLDAALSSVLTKDDSSLTLFNPLSWERKAEILLPDGATGVTVDGTAAKTQLCSDGVHALVELPSMGTKTVTLTNDEVGPTAEKDSLTLENDLVSFTFNENGEIVSIIDKESGLEQLSGKANRFALYNDMPLFCDAWDIDSFYEELELEIKGKTEMGKITEGPLFSSLEIRKEIGNSVLTQRVILKKGAKQLDLVTEVDWKETHKLLKVFFDTNLNTSEIVSEMQFGHIARPAHRSDNYSKERFEVCQHKWSALCEGKRIFSVLNDCKYGVGAIHGSMGVTLLKSACDPDLYADRGIQRFTYSIRLSSDLTDVIRAAWELNAPAVSALGKMEDRSYFKINADNVIIDTVKCAEDGSGDIIVRLYESRNAMTRCYLETAIPVKSAKLTNMLEKEISELKTEDGRIPLTLRGFEVVTVRLAR